VVAIVRAGAFGSGDGVTPGLHRLQPRRRVAHPRER
jgi:hypothetical protein